MKLVEPIAVFDSGLGSYSVVQEIQRQYPDQDIIYLADREAFPYGEKPRSELLSLVSSAITFLESFHPTAIVVASNAPSILLLDVLRRLSSVPLLGITPPIDAAEVVSQTGSIGILGVHSLVNSNELRTFIANHSRHSENILSFDASSLVQVVESGQFTFDPITVAGLVREFISSICADHPTIDTFTLSSTHLPWLRRFFEESFPMLNFVDPARALLSQLTPTRAGSGAVQALVTVPNAGSYSLDDFRKLLEKLGITLKLEVVNFRALRS